MFKVAIETPQEDVIMFKVNNINSRVMTPFCSGAEFHNTDFKQTLTCSNSSIKRLE